MGFQLVPKSVTLNDPERRYGRYFALFYTELGSFGGQLRKIRSTLTAKECSPKNLFFNNMTYGDISSCF